MIGKKVVSLGVVAASMLLVVGCGTASRGTISKEQYRQIEMNMTEDEVRAVAGDPYDQSDKRREGSPTRSYSQNEWQYNGGDVLIMFRNGKVVFKHHDEWGFEGKYD